MPFNISKFINIVDPIAKLVASAASSAMSQAENALIDTAGDLFAKAGLSSGTRKNLMSNLGDAAVAGVAAEFFGTFNKGVNRASRDQIIEGKGDSREMSLNDYNALLNDESDGEGKNSNELIFPKDLQRYHTKIEFFEYERPNPAVTAANKIYKGSICLPLTRTIEERHDISYNSGLELGAIPATFANEIFNGKLKGKNNTMRNIAGLWAGKSVLEGLSGLGGNEFLAIIQQESKASLNPNISVLFRAPTFRSHRFEWLLAPNNEEESKIVRKIIKKLKFAALPNFFKDTTAVLDFPLMCRVKLMPWADPADKDMRAEYKDNYLFDYKYAVIESLNINYSPESLAFFNPEGGSAPAPAFVSITMNLIEIEYFTAEEFGREPRDTDSIKAVQEAEKAIGAIESFVTDVYANNVPAPAPSGTYANSTLTTKEYSSDRVRETVAVESGANTVYYDRVRVRTENTWSDPDWHQVYTAPAARDGGTESTVTVVIDKAGEVEISNE